MNGTIAKRQTSRCTLYNATMLTGPLFSLSHGSAGVNANCNLFDLSPHSEEGNPTHYQQTPKLLFFYVDIVKCNINFNTATAEAN